MEWNGMFEKPKQLRRASIKLEKCKQLLADVRERKNNNMKERFRMK